MDEKEKARFEAAVAGLHEAAEPLVKYLQEKQHDLLGCVIVESSRATYYDVRIRTIFPLGEEKNQTVNTAARKHT